MFRFRVIAALLCAVLSQPVLAITYCCCISGRKEPCCDSTWYPPSSCCQSAGNDACCQPTSESEERETSPCKCIVEVENREAPLLTHEVQLDFVVLCTEVNEFAITVEDIPVICSQTPWLHHNQRQARLNVWLNKVSG